ncbi:MAG: thioredoxin family protein [Phycisphaerales bacterium]
MKNHFVTIVLLALVLYIITPKVMNIISGPAETPGIFVQKLSLQAAQEQSETTGKPMLVLVTADWCPPCQALKKGALTDDSVTQWVKENMVPVYLEESVNPEEIRMLPVNSYPTTLVIQDGNILGQFAGNASASSFLSKIKQISN